MLYLPRVIGAFLRLVRLLVVNVRGDRLGKLGRRAKLAFGYFDGEAHFLQEYGGISVLVGGHDNVDEGRVLD